MPNENPKSSVDKIRARFDNEVERFSNLETGQSAVIDSPLCMDLVASAAAIVTPHAKDILDIGCGAGNYTLKLIEKLRLSAATPAINCTLIDLSQPMLDRAVERIRPHTTGALKPIQGDMRDISFDVIAFDIIMASATLHHLRTDEEWHTMFTHIYAALRPGGSFWIFDMVDHAHPGIAAMLKQRYGDYLSSLKGGGEAGRAYRDHVFAYIEEEDSPKPMLFQVDLLREVGFAQVEVLHKSVMGAAFGGIKSA